MKFQRMTGRYLEACAREARAKERVDAELAKLPDPDEDLVKSLAAKEHAARFVGRVARETYYPLDAVHPLGWP